MKIVICDDNKPFADMLMDMIKRIVVKNHSFCDTEINYYYIYPAKDLINYSKHSHIDILFLDISMPGIDGLEVAERFFDYNPDTTIIFVSSFENYVFYTFRYKPFRFLRKNNLSNELEEAVISALDNILISNIHLNISNRNECVQINLSRIIYIEKEKDSNYLIVQTIDEYYRYRNNIGDLAEQLKEYQFVKINSGTIINLKHIKSIKNSTIILSNNEKLSIAKKHINSVRQKYIEFISGRRISKNAIVH